MLRRVGLALQLLLGPVALALECFKNTPDFDYQVQYCNPQQFPFCLKADSFDGRVYRNCAAPEQCPQGVGCAPITYDEDGTTDFVCCCAQALCNLAAPNGALGPLVLGLALLKVLLPR